MTRRSLHLALTLSVLALTACSESTAPSQPEVADGLSVVPLSSQPDLTAVGTPAVAANTWATKHSMLFPARSNMRAGTINNIIYVVGGDTGVEPNREIANVDAYDVATNTWSRRKPLPSGRSWINGASVIGGKLYVTGGVSPTSVSKTLFVYDPGSNSWVKKASMPAGGGQGAQGVIGGLLYVYVAHISGGQLFRYHPVTNTWVELAAPPVAHINGVGGVIHGKFYLVGGEGGRDLFPTTTLNVYNPATNTWTTKASMSTRRRDFAGGVINGKLYVAGGVNDLDEVLTTSEVYDPATDKWTTKASMPTAQAGGASAVASGKLFVIGGFESSKTRKVQAYTP